MKTKSGAALMVVLGMSLALPAIADHHEMHEGPNFVPVELWPCSFQEGKGMDDLNKVIRKWNTFMDDQGDTTYSAWVLTPNFVNGNTLDVGWIGVWPSSQVMGQSMEAGTSAENQAMTAEFFKVVSCGQHALFASVAMSPPAENSPDRAVLRFSNCTMSEGKTGSDAAAAVAAWSKHQQESDSASGMFMWWPAFGEDPNAEYDFKMVTANPDYTAFASDWESFTNGRGYEKYDEMVDDAFSCDIGRIYDARSVRRAKPAS